MTKVYILTKFRIFYRNLSQIGLVRGIFLLYIIFLAGTRVQDLAQRLFVLPVLYFVIIYLYHTYRNDHQFLKSLCNSPKRLLATEYFLIFLPFCMLSILNAHFLELVLYPCALVLTIQFARYKNIRLRHAPRRIVLTKGSLEFIIGIRTGWLWLLLVYPLSFIAVYVQNRSFFFVAFTAGCAVVATFCSIHKHQLYLLHYRNLVDCLLINARHTFINASLLLLPMLLVAAFMPSLLSFSLRIYSSALLLCYTLIISAYLFTDSHIAHAIVCFILFLLFLVSLESIFFAAMFVLFALGLLYVSSKSICRLLK